MLKSEVAVNNVNHVRKKMRVVHCGHSFVTRATQAVLKPRWEYFSSEHLVGGTQPYDAENLAKAYGLDKRVEYMYSVSKHIKFIVDIEENINDIKKFDPDFVMLDIGMNDIAEITDEHWKSKIRSLVLICKNIANQFDSGVTVCFLEVIPRIGFTGGNMTTSKFETRANYFNNLLKMEQGKALHRGTYLRYAKIMGVKNMYTPHGVHQKINIEDFLSEDGIHPKFGEYRDHYAKSIKKSAC